MPFNPPTIALSGIAPELCLLVGALLLLVIDALLPDRFSRSYLPLASSLALLVSVGLAVMGWRTVTDQGSELQLGGAVGIAVLAAMLAEVAATSPDRPFAAVYWFAGWSIAGGVGT